MSIHYIGFKVTDWTRKVKHAFGIFLDLWLVIV